MRNHKLSYLAVATLVTCSSGLGTRSATADDNEVFFSISNGANGKANVLFIVDTSQSMYSVEESTPKEGYKPGETYAGACSSTSYYWTTSGGTTPTCDASWKPLDSAQFACNNWRAGVDTNGYQTKTTRVAQKPSSSWVNLSQTTALTSCEGDVPAQSPAIDWTAKSKGKPVFPSAAYTVYSGNWLNWNAQSGGSKYRIDIMREAVGRLVTNTEGIRVGLMRYGYDGARDFKQNTATACEVVPDGDESNRSSNGAPIIFPVSDLDGSTVSGFKGGDVRAQIRYQLGLDASNENLGWVVNPSLSDANQPFQIAKGGGGTCPIPLMTPGGRSPIGGAMMEAFLYYSGSDWSLKYGKQADLGSTFDYPSVPQSRTGPNSDTYRSPISESCAKNFIVLLSDGTTEQDNDVDGKIEQLPGFQQKIGSKSCDKEAYLTGTPPPSQCVDDIAEYMYETDMRSTVPGLNNVITYTVGFKLGNDSAANSARSLLQETAGRGGGEFFEADSAQALEAALTEITRQILTENTSFSSPAVTVNAFNRTQNLNDLYMSLFRPSFNYRWLGNIKKYRLEPDGDIVDRDGKQAVDPGTGFFRTTATSFWSDVQDGADVTLGGAAGEIVYGTRKVYSNLTGNANVSLASNDNNLTFLNDDSYAATVEDILGIEDTDSVTVANLILWARGKDVADADEDGVTDESRKDMGDPLHGKPLTVIYGGTAENPNLDDGVIFAVTNDGFLHAINPGASNNPADGGNELWSFIPANLLSRLRDLYYNSELADPSGRVYGIDGNIRLLRVDNNNNGVIETADADGKRDKVYIFFGQRRGGSYYYALDVSSKNAPRLMWAKSFAAEGAGQSWSSPTTAKVRIGDTTKLVLIFGGGYDTGQDQFALKSNDDEGRGIFMVDALDGSVLWRAGPTDSGANLVLSDMLYPIPGDVRVIDLTGDGFADRMYASDLGGQVWRFDITNGKPASGAEGERLVEGGLLASLGDAGGAVSIENSLRFFYAPDPALVKYNGRTFINVAIGSGHREFPVSETVVENWFFSVRDYNPFTPLLTSQYQTSCSSSPCHELVTEGDLADVTESSECTDGNGQPVPCVPVGAAGWRLKLPETGEKVLAESRTFPIGERRGRRPDREFR